MKKKAIVAVVALVLVLCCAMGGTLAWLVDSTTEVKNTFTFGDINIDLFESEDLNLKMIPGNPIHKDPTVTVETGSEACWLFVKVDESNNFDDFMTYAIAEGWTFFNTTATGDKIDTDTNDGYVIYRQVDDTIGKQQNTNFAVLNNNEVLVKNTVTKGMLNAEDFEKPTLTFTAYAVQQDNLTLEQAYNQAFNAN